ncbi:MAG: F-type H+-transporting ATPase subunit gamma [Parcubacteria group bacterium Greene0714_21]|nr:MAG: F-type H+-transporting ATPase subunit gamma [Parcubacteria group bacterium Greene0416_39]TSC97528.1 MAG: F-type H+-transporting ATPase subunit gamma [Parcubacteria group bacterium Greene1014_47]TSD04404.1 MAG: F-type H+-transporting ATPase subunit gamma [Parcubacteria group bacterium Greene0714_21]
MASKQQLKTKLQAVGNIKQMTRAMELVAATKMRKSQEVAFRARPYAKKALSLLRNLLIASGEENVAGRSHFFKRTGIKKECLVVVTSDRGLCGAYNSQVLRAAWRFSQEHEDFDIVAVGRKANDFFMRRGKTLANSFAHFSDITTLADLEPLANWLLERYKSHAYDQVMFCSTVFISALKQRVEAQEILPLTMDALEKIIKSIVPKTGRYSEYFNGNTGESIPYVFEPTKTLVFEKLVEELVKVEIVHLVFEANASEHSSRMIAMKNATENAEDLVVSLTLALNKARQSSITQELAEITSAKEALTAD